MKIVLDTTVFENGFNGRSAEVPLLKSLLTRTGSELYIPHVVYQETLNRVRKRANDANSKIDSLQRLTGGGEGLQKIEVEEVVRRYEGILKELFRGLGARILSYPAVSHEELVRRALSPVKPFVDGGRGYRDALVWHSLVELLESTSDDLVFISQNTADWCGIQKDGFHPDLIGEILKKGIPSERLVLVSTLAEFNRKYTVSSLAVEQQPIAAGETTVDYWQLLIDCRELVEDHIWDDLGELLIEEDLIDEGFTMLGMSGPENVRGEPPRTLDAERRLLQFGADYRLTIDIVVSRDSSWAKRFSTSLKQDWGGGRVRLYVTLPIHADFRMIQRGENTEQFSLASIAIIDGKRPD